MPKTITQSISTAQRITAELATRPIEALAPPGKENFTVSQFDSVKDSQAKSAEITLPQLEHFIRRPIATATKAGDLWTGATYRNAHRAKANVQEISIALFDVDEGASLDEAKACLETLGCAYALHTTWSHDTGGGDKFRVILPLANPIPKSEWLRFWTWMNQCLGGALDPATKDESRIFFVPMIRQSDAPYRCEIEFTRPLLDWTTLDLAPPVPVPARAPTPRALPERNGNSLQPYVAQAVRQETELLATARDGARNHRLNQSAFALAQFVASGLLSEDEIRMTLQPVAEAVGLSASEITATLRSGIEAGIKQPRDLSRVGTETKSEVLPTPDAPPTPDDEEEKPRISKAKQLVELAQHGELFFNGEGRTFASVPVRQHIEVYAAKSVAFKRWLAGAYWAQCKQSIHPPAVAEALLTIEAIALYEGKAHEVHTRIAEQNGNLYLDLCDETWRQVEITKNGWQVIPNSTVRFVRTNGMLPLPEPTRGGTLEDLRACLNLQGEPNQRQWVLLASWLIAAFRPNAPFPLLTVHGEQGSGKSTASRMIRALIDPHSTPLRSAPRDERDLMIAATNSWIVAFDNLTHLPESLSNALCRLSTGGGFGTRELYSNDDEKLFSAMRPVILNGIAEVASRPDLIDRSVLIYLPTIPEHLRRDERDEVYPDFEAKRPQILGALLDCVSAALRRLPMTKLASKPRMADFAKWATAAEEAAGFAQGEFLKAYQANRQDANGLAIESSPVAMAVVAYLSEPDDRWTGTIGDFLKVLNGRLEKGGEDPRRKVSWPQTARKLSTALKEIIPNLRRENIEITFGGHTKKGATVTLRKNEVSTVTIVTSSPTIENKRVIGDGRGDDWVMVAEHRHPIVTQSSPPNPLKIKKYDEGDDGDGQNGLFTTSKKRRVSLGKARVTNDDH